MRILITGANGLLGQKLVTLLIAKGEEEIIATGRGANRLPFNAQKFTYAPLDITQNQAVAQCLATYQPDVVIHTAAMTNVDQCEEEKEACWRLNVTAVQHLAEACRAQRPFSFTYPPILSSMARKGLTMRLRKRTRSVITEKANGRQNSYWQSLEWRMPLYVRFWFMALHMI